MKKQSIPSIYKVGSHLTFVLGNKTHTINRQDAFFDRAVEAYKIGDWDTVLSFVDRPQFVTRFSEGRIKVVDGAVLFNDKPLHGYVVNKVLEFMDKGLPIGPIVRFLDDLQNAKAEHVKEDLYLFLEKNDLPLTDDGGFLAYKLVNADGTPHYHSGNGVVYRVGETVEMKFEDCATSRNECGGAGLYAGNRHYWGDNSFDARGDYTGGGRMLLVKLMPSWVVSVPHSEDGRKLRAYRLDVISEYNNAPRKQETHVKKVESQPAKKSTQSRDRFGRFGSTKNVPAFKRDAGGRFAKKINVLAKVRMPTRDSKGRFI